MIDLSWYGIPGDMNGWNYQVWSLVYWTYGVNNRHSTKPNYNIYNPTPQTKLELEIISYKRCLNPNVGQIYNILISHFQRIFIYQQQLFNAG